MGLKFIAILLITLNVAQAAQVVPLKKGEVAPFAGVLFDPPAEQKMRLTAEQLDYYKALSESQSKINQKLVETNQIMDDRLQLYLKQNDVLASRLTESRDSAWWERAGMFVLGAVLTGAISYGVVRTLR